MTRDQTAREIAELFGCDYMDLDPVKRYDLDQVLANSAIESKPALERCEITFEELETELHDRGLQGKRGVVKTWLGYLAALDAIAERLGRGRLTYPDDGDKCPAMALADAMDEALVELSNKVDAQAEELTDLRIERDQLVTDLEQAHTRREALESEREALETEHEALALQVNTPAERPDATNRLSAIDPVLVRALRG